MDGVGTAAARKHESAGLSVPFDHDKLDSLMDEAGIDALIVDRPATSGH